MTSAMRAVLLDAPGPPEALQIRELPIPEPPEGWVLIHVKAFGLNRSELHTRLGLARGVTFPRVLGIDASFVTGFELYVTAASSPAECRCARLSHLAHEEPPRRDSTDLNRDDTGELLPAGAPWHSPRTGGETSLERVRDDPEPLAGHLGAAAHGAAREARVRAEIDERGSGDQAPARPSGRFELDRTTADCERSVLG